MEKKEAWRLTDHYRCRLCGQLSPITETLCTKPSCRAQLGIYGELVAGEEQTAPEAKQPKTVIPEARPYQQPAPQIKAAPPKAPTPRQAQPQKSSAPAAAPSRVGKPFMRKGILLLLLDIAVFCLYAGIAYMAAERDPQLVEMEDVLLCAGILLPEMLLCIFLAHKGRHILHGLLCIVTGAVSFFAAGEVLGSPGYTAPMFFAVMAAYFWLGVLSFIKMR